MTSAPQVTRRLFFAFWPDADTRSEMDRACRKAIRGSGGRPVVPANWHATVAFLGAVPESLLPAVCAAGAGLPGQPFELFFDGVEFWPRPQVLVAVCGQQPEFAGILARELWVRLTPIGLTADPRPLRAHVTLARKVQRPPQGMVMRPVRWPVRDIALVQSVTDPAGANYRVLERWPLDFDPAGAPGSPADPPLGPDSPQK
jgi:2'-5' RNA ligase